jgi:hypothetical protein
MDSYKFDDLPPEKASRPGLVWNILTGVVVLMTVCMGVYFLVLLVNPYLPINPLAPPAPTKAFETLTPTLAPLTLPPTWTPTVTAEPTATRERPPTFTPFPSPTPLMLPTVSSGFTSTPEPKPTPTPKATSMPFTVSVSALESAPINGIGCNWLGVAGNAEDLNGSPLLFLTVKVSGQLGEKAIDSLTVTGTAPKYGQGGFEFTLSNVPTNSENTIWIQLFDQAGLPLSDQVYFSTFDDCKKNLVLVRFKRVR